MTMTCQTWRTSLCATLSVTTTVLSPGTSPRHPQRRRTARTRGRRQQMASQQQPAQQPASQWRQRSWGIDLGQVRLRGTRVMRQLGRVRIKPKSNCYSNGPPPLSRILSTEPGLLRSTLLAHPPCGPVGWLPQPDERASLRLPSEHGRAAAAGGPAAGRPAEPECVALRGQCMGGQQTCGRLAIGRCQGQEAQQDGPKVLRGHPHLLGPFNFRWWGLAEAAAVLPAAECVQVSVHCSWAPTAALLTGWQVGRRVGRAPASDVEAVVRCCLQLGGHPHSPGQPALLGPAPLGGGVQRQQDLGVCGVGE